MFGNQKELSFLPKCNPILAVIDQEKESNTLLQNLKLGIEQNKERPFNILSYSSLSELPKKEVKTKIKAPHEKGIINTNWINTITTKRPAVILYVYYVNSSVEPKLEEQKMYQEIEEIRKNDKYVKIVMIIISFGTYHFEIEYQNDSFKQMSPGKKAFVILKLILDFSDSKKPVLIDQPEDSLDNRAIYKDLTSYIKKTKMRRQIIVVTHNPNIVVGGDCENVIIANQSSDDNPNKDGEQFDYKNGSLENDSSTSNSDYILERYSIKEHVCDILEGGKEAFEKRERKYNIQ